MYYVSWFSLFQWVRVLFDFSNRLIIKIIETVEDLKHLRKLVLHKCNYLDNEALPMLAAVKNSLEELQLSACGNVDDNGVMSLSHLSKLQHLTLYDLPEVKCKEKCTQFLQTALPNCSIDFPYAQASEIKSPKTKK